MRFYRRRLPHLQCESHVHFVTFCTHRRTELPPKGRDLVLASCKHDDGVKLDLHAVVIMPDHVHILLTPRKDPQTGTDYSLANILDAIKGASAHAVNKLLHRTGKLWQTESYDHVLRLAEPLDDVVEYICQNPVRRGIVARAEEYLWVWKR